MILIFCSSHAINISNQKVEDVLSRLDFEISNRETHINQQQNIIDSLKNSLKQEPDKLETIMKIGNEYIAFDNDSTLFYFNKGYTLASELNNDSLAIAFQLKRDTYLPLAGFIDYATKDYESINFDKIPTGLHQLYHESGKQLYSYISSFFYNYPNIQVEWDKKSFNCQSLHLKSLDKSSIQYKLNSGEYYLNLKEYSKAKAILEEALNSLDDSNNSYARVAHAIATIANIQNNENEYIYYLALSSIADIKSATLEVVSLQELGAKLLERNDVKRAHTYSSIALANAVNCKASMRMIQSSKAMPIIQQAHIAEIENWQKRMKSINIIFIILAIILISILVFLRYRTNRLRILQRKLEIANNIKELYISQFLTLCSIYMEKLTQFSDTVNRKISAGKADDLYKITKSGKFIEEQSKEFYDVFDNAFLNIYPNFIENVNALLLPGKQIELKDDEKLNTDLRILAFMKLGIDESSRIAQMLNYSVNTIYSYRNKLKNRAIDRDNFEENIIKIKSIS